MFSFIHPGYCNSIAINIQYYSVVCVIAPLPTTAILDDVGDVLENIDIIEKQKVTKPSHNTLTQHCDTFDIKHMV